MIPAFAHGGVLPPFVGANGAIRGSRAPFKTNLSTITARLGGTPERRQLIQGLLTYRSALRDAGIVSGYQLIDGSFTEDCENVNQRPPADIDLVTFAHLPVYGQDIQHYLQQHLQLFDRVQTKAAFSCDAFFVNLGNEPRLVVEDTMYWYGLFSHQRVTHLWKGTLLVPLQSDDAAAQAALGAAQVPQAANLQAGGNLGGGANGP